MLIDFPHWFLNLCNRSLLEGYILLTEASPCVSCPLYLTLILRFVITIDTSNPSFPSKTLVSLSSSSHSAFLTVLIPLSVVTHGHPGFIHSFITSIYIAPLQV